MICPNCGTENRDSYKFCGQCGAPRPAETPVQGTVYVPEAPTIPKMAEAPVESPPLQVSVPYTPVPVIKPRRKRRGWLTCLIIFFILLCLGVVALVGIAFLKPEWLPFDIPFLARDNNLLIGYPNSDGETDLYLLRLGQTIDKGTLLAEGVVHANTNFIFLQQDTIANLSGYPYDFGAFIPGQPTLLYWYSNGEGEITLSRVAISDKQPVTLWEDDTELLRGALLPNLEDIFLRSEQDSEQSCFLSRAGASAEEVLESGICYLTTDFSTVFAKFYADTEISARLLTLADNAEYTPLDALENIGVVEISGDGTRLAYTDLEDAPNVVLINSQDGSTLVEGSDAYAVVDQGFAERGHIGYFISENNDGNLDLYLLSDSGASLINSALSLAAEVSLNGDHIIYMSGDFEGERTLNVRNVSSGNDVEVIRGDHLRFDLANSLSLIFISTVEDDELSVYSANLDGSGLVNLFTGEGYLLRNVYYVPGQPYVFLLLSSQDGLTLLATRPDQADEFQVVENWSSVTLLDTSSDGLQLLYAGAEAVDDDASLYLASLDAKTSATLDNHADGISNGLFSADDQSVIYTALTGSGPDDAEIRRIQTDAADPAEVLYSDAVLVAAQWDILLPFQISYGALLQQSTSYCPGAQEITAGLTLEANLEAGVRNCYRYDGIADESVTFWIEAVDGLDTSLTLYDRQGNYLDSDDYGLNSIDPRLIATFPEDGIYYLEISSFGENTGGYSLSSVGGINYCPGVDQLAVGDELSGLMDDVGQVFYGFSANADQELTFWVESTSLDPMLSLYDSQGNMINSDDNNRDGIDPLLITTIPEDGNYCLEVNTFGFETGPFSISMVEGSVFCPGAGQINLSDTVTGSVADGRRTCYQVNGVAGTSYTFTVNSPTSTDTVLELYDATGVMLDSDDDSAGYPNPMLSFTPSDAGTYYIVIRGYGTGSAGEYEMTLSEGPRGCSDALPIQLGDIVNGTVQADQETCYVFDGTGGVTVQFDVDSYADTVLVLYDEEGNELFYNDDGGEGLNPRIRALLPYSGRYYIAVHGYASNTGSFTLSFQIAPEVEDVFANPTFLPANTRLRGVITEADYFYNETLSFTNYGHAYYFDGTGGQTIQIDVFADSLGSEIDPIVYLFDSNGIYLVSDDDGGIDYDSQLVYTLPSSGRYYVIVANLRGAYGTSSTHFYELLLTNR